MGASPVALCSAASGPALTFKQIYQRSDGTIVNINCACIYLLSISSNRKGIVNGNGKKHSSNRAPYNHACNHAEDVVSGLLFRSDMASIGHTE